MSASSYIHISVRDLYISRKGIHKWDFPCRVVLHDNQSFVNKKFVPLFFLKVSLFFAIPGSYMTLRQAKADVI